MSEVRGIARQSAQEQSGVRPESVARNAHFERLVALQSSKRVVSPNRVEKGRFPALRSGNYADNPFWIERSPLVGCPPVNRCLLIENNTFSRSVYTEVYIAVNPGLRVDSKGFTCSRS